jgi:DNA mismatch endonuclease (patch repair protein)
LTPPRRTSMPWRPTPKREYRSRPRHITSRMMSRVGSKGSRAEMALRRALSALGLRFRLHSSVVEGKPDIVFRTAQVAVFVDGDFWHGRSIVDDGVAAFKRTMRTSRRDWWVLKLRRNIERDLSVNETLKRNGWRVVRIWESDVLREPRRIAQRVQRIVERRAQRTAGARR